MSSSAELRSAASTSGVMVRVRSMHESSQMSPQFSRPNCWASRVRRFSVKACTHPRSLARGRAGQMIVNPGVAHEQIVVVTGDIGFAICGHDSVALAILV